MKRDGYVCESAIPHQRTILLMNDGPVVFVEQIEDPHWLPVGYVPTPRGYWKWFRYHLFHGILMGYPLWKVLLYAALESGDPDD